MASNLTVLGKFKIAKKACKCAILKAYKENCYNTATAVMDGVKAGFLEFGKIQECLDMIYTSCGSKEQQNFAQFFNLELYVTDEGEQRCKYKPELTRLHM
jgi:hypothetical protein